MNYENELRRLQLIFRDREVHRELYNQRGVLAQSLLDHLQQLIDAPNITAELRSRICDTMIRLSKNSDLYPSCLTIQRATMVGRHPVDGGGFGEVYKGTFGTDGRIVCLKVARVYSTDINRFLKQFLREAIVWRQLKHPNLLPCLGLYYLDDTHERICLVSPWMENGNLVKYLEGRPRESMVQLQLMYDIAAGLSRLHEWNIIHGDLKGVNILITSSHRACLADFGLSRVADKITSSTSTGRPGSVRWSAPEILEGDSATKESDIYSCGCVYYEVITGLLPFHDLANDGAVIAAIIRGKRPSKPPIVQDAPYDTIWSLITRCWSSSPDSRPQVCDIPDRLAELLQAAGTAIVPAEDWDSQLFVEVQNSVDQHRPSEQVIEFLSAAEVKCVTRKLGHPPVPAAQDPEHHHPVEQGNGSATTFSNTLSDSPVSSPLPDAALAQGTNVVQRRAKSGGMGNPMNFWPERSHVFHNFGGS